MRHLLALLIALLLLTAAPSTAATTTLEWTAASTTDATPDDDAARDGAVADIVAHMRWAARHVDTTFTDKATLLRAAADAAASLSNEPAYAAVMRQAGALVPGLADYAAFRLSKQLDTANRRRLDALDALATTARNRLPDRPDVEARARYHAAVVAAATDTIRAWRDIRTACRLIKTKATATPDTLREADRLLYDALRAVFMRDFIEGDNPLRYADLRRLERDALRSCSAWPASADKATLLSYLSILRSTATYGREADETDAATFPAGRPDGLPDSVPTELWRTGSWYLDAAYSTASAAVGYSHPDFLTLRMATLDAASADFDRLFTYVLAYWPLGTPMAGEVKITQWLSRLAAGLPNEDTRMATLLLSYYRSLRSRRRHAGPWLTARPRMPATQQAPRNNRRQAPSHLRRPPDVRLPDRRQSVPRGGRRALTQPRPPGRPPKLDAYPHRAIARHALRPERRTRESPPHTAPRHRRSRPPARNSRPAL